VKLCTCRRAHPGLLTSCLAMPVLAQCMRRMRVLSPRSPCRPNRCPCGHKKCKCSGKGGAGGKSRAKKDVKLNPRFPRLPPTTPLTYTLTMKACLSTAAHERPTATQLRTLLNDMNLEVQQGQYIDCNGNRRVRFSQQNTLGTCGGPHAALVPWHCEPLHGEQPRVRAAIVQHAHPPQRRAASQCVSDE
jgi:hypothetical protein